MTVEADLKTVIGTVVARVFPDFAPVGTTRPYSTFQQVGGAVINPIAKETPDLQNGEFQINVYGNSRASVATLMLQLEAAMRTASQFNAKPMGAPVADFDADVLVFWARQDFSVWSTR